MNTSRGKEQCKIVKLHVKFQKQIYSDFMHFVANVYHEYRYILLFSPKIFGPVALKDVKIVKDGKVLKNKSNI